MRRLFTFAAVSIATINAACVTTSMQGYADRDLPSRPVRHIVALVVAPTPLGHTLQTSIADEGKKRGIVAEDALALFPPTRQYSDAEIKRVLQERGIDAVLIINVGDTGIRKEYAGTVFHGNYSGTTLGSGTATTFDGITNLNMSASTSGTMTATATPTYRYSRQTTFQARLIEPSSARNLWVGGGQVRAGGLLFVGDSVSATSSVSAIFDDLLNKGIIARPSA